MPLKLHRLGRSPHFQNGCIFTASRHPSTALAWQLSLLNGAKVKGAFVTLCQLAASLAGRPEIGARAGNARLLWVLRVRDGSLLYSPSVTF